MCSSKFQGWQKTVSPLAAASIEKHLPDITTNYNLINPPKND